MKLLLVDIDGLRADVFSDALTQRRIPKIGSLLGGAALERGIQIPAWSTAPSITFTSQASLFTGAHPSQHGISGNQFFDRFGTNNEGLPRYYAFDVGDTLAVDDAVEVFTAGLASDCLRVPTIYRRFSEWGWNTVVAGNMYADGATTWIKPNLVNLARFTKGGNLFGMNSQAYDRHILDRVIDQLGGGELPDLLTFYLMGLDHESHVKGPQIQAGYLEEVVDPLVGALWDFIMDHSQGPPPVVVVFSDHGQVGVQPDDRHSLRLAFPFEREMGHLFDALGLDVHDYPGEDPDCDAVVASNGGLAHVYLRDRRGAWSDAPDFDRDVRRVAGAFWEAHQTGRYAPELEGALAGVLIRDVAADGWYAAFHALTPGGEILSLEEWFGNLDSQRGIGHPGLYVDPVSRLDNLASPFVGDLILVSCYQDGYYFGAPVSGVHGGLHPDDSGAVLVYGWPGAGAAVSEQMRAAVLEAVKTRCQEEGDRQPSTVDLLTGLLAVLER
jgi:hypothetical protein